MRNAYEIGMTVVMEKFRALEKCKGSLSDDVGTSYQPINVFSKSDRVALQNICWYFGSLPNASTDQ